MQALRKKFSWKQLALICFCSCTYHLFSITFRLFTKFFLDNQHFYRVKIALQKYLDKWTWLMMSIFWSHSFIHNTSFVKEYHTSRLQPRIPNEIWDFRIVGLNSQFLPQWFIKEIFLKKVDYKILRELTCYDHFWGQAIDLLFWEKLCKFRQKLRIQNGLKSTFFEDIEKNIDLIFHWHECKRKFKRKNILLWKFFFWKNFNYVLIRKIAGIFDQQDFFYAFRHTIKPENETFCNGRFQTCRDIINAWKWP